MQKTSVLEEMCVSSLHILPICQSFFTKCKNSLKISNFAVISHVYEAQTHLIDRRQTQLNVFNRQDEESFDARQKRKIEKR